MSAPYVTIVKHFPVHAGEVESLDLPDGLFPQGQLTSSRLILHSPLKPVPDTLFVNCDRISECICLEGTHLAAG